LDFLRLNRENEACEKRLHLLKNKHIRNIFFTNVVNEGSGKKDKGTAVREEGRQSRVHDRLVKGSVLYFQSSLTSLAWTLLTTDDERHIAALVKLLRNQNKLMGGTTQIPFYLSP